MLSSGQWLGAMPDELSYIASKGAIDALTLSLSDELADRGLTVDAVNPGPIDTGHLTGATPDAQRTPSSARASATGIGGRCASRASPAARATSCMLLSTGCPFAYVSVSSMPTRR